MSAPGVDLAPGNADDGVHREISACLDPKAPRSFFLYAGAGSGKTRALKEALETFRDRHGDTFRRSGQKVAVITYTNAAVDEIASRVSVDPLFPISTIHSFCWQQIGSFHTDIRSWLLSSLPRDLAEICEKQAKGRAGTKAALDRERGITAIEKRLEWLGTPRRFTYNPNGDNFGAESLSHSEVLKITTAFILTKPSMRTVLVNKFPFLLIDESQDTNRDLMGAFFALEVANKGRFALGLFGDTMQRIYADGKPDLGRDIPPDWARPAMKLNHRSPRRIVSLGNSLRSAVDGQRQAARDDSPKGLVRLFVVSATANNKPEIERKIRARMAVLCDDDAWTDGRAAVKTLTLEHHMAASRTGFLPMFQALDQDSRLSTGLRTGDLAGLRLFTELAAPLVAAATAKDGFGLMSHLRRTSPLLRRAALAGSKDPANPLLDVRRAVEAIIALQANPATRFLDVLQCVATHKLFDIPPSLRPFVFLEKSTGAGAEAEEPSETDDGEENPEASPVSLWAWRAFLETPYDQIVAYADYVGDRGPYGTHQGVKGLEFDRVLVVMDDSAAKGFLFSYEKLFGAKPRSAEDQRRSAEGSETTVDRTRRLLYVTCTRARRSLALVAYTDSPNDLAAAVVREGWFGSEELERM